MRLLLPQDLVDIVPMGEAVRVVRAAFEDAGRNPLLNTPRRRVHTPAGVRVSVHQGAPVSLGTTGLMTHCEWVEIQGSRQVYRAKHPPFQILFDAQQGTPLAVIIGDPGSPHAPPHALSGLRTAATSAVGTQALVASDRSVRLGLFGSGEQARYHLLAFKEVLQLVEVWVFSPHRDHCQTLVEEMQPLLPDTRFDIANNPDQVVDNAEVILTATNSNVPVFDGRRLRAGQHITSIVGSNIGLVLGGFVRERRREIDDATILRADTIVVNSIEQLKIDQQADIYDHAERGLISWDHIHELGEVLVGKAPGRRSPDSITLFKNNAGQGIADVAIGTAVYQAAVRRGLGQEIPLSSVFR